MAAATPSINAIYSDKDRKYDRQTRLWGSHGQKALETSKICVLGSGGTASETLKNLVLPNIGDITVVDDAVVSPNDCGNNFFIEEESLGTPRATEIIKNLLEMNPEVKGESIIKNPEDIINNNLSFFDNYQLIIVATNPPLKEQYQLLLSDYLYKKNIPLLLLKTIGLISSARLQLLEHYIGETHPSGNNKDLFIHPSQWNHFPELIAYIEKFNLFDENMDEKDHSRIPSIAILYSVLKEWMKNHNNKIPTTFDEKKAFKDYIVTFSWDFTNENNFAEAVEYAYRIYDKPAIHPLVQSVLEDPKINQLDKDTANFWFVVRAVKDFMAAEGHGCLPVAVDIPDMHCESSTYVDIKGLFQKKSQEDLDHIIKRVQSLLLNVGRLSTDITDQEIIYFVTNIRQIAIIRTRSLVEEYSKNGINIDALNDYLEPDYISEEELQANPDLIRVKDAYWYIGLRVAEQFYTKYNRWPGDNDDLLESDQEIMVTMGQQFINDYSLNCSFIPEVFQEITRYGSTEPHNIAAFMGGIGSQIALQVIMKQYVPINHTFIYSGIDCSSTTLKI